jgi:Flp pilus assembly protein TadD
VTDACEHCGHCTAACTSNVRVHEEVRDYGMVVDPGCMKCLDCISVCPTDALYFGFGKPALLARKRAGAAPGKRFKSRVYDLSLPEELAAGVLFVVLFVSYIKLAYWIPLLMAMGMAGIGTFLAWKTWRLLRDPSLRIQNAQLKLKGRLRPAGAITAALALAMLALAGWSAAVKASKLGGRIIDQRLSAGLPFERVFAAGYRPEARDKSRAKRALALYRFAAAPRDGGIGWADIELLRRMGWLSAVAGNLEGARTSFERGIELAGGHDIDVDDLLNALVQISAIQGRTPGDFAAELRGILRRSPTAPVRVVLAGLLLQLGDTAGAVENALQAAVDHPRDARTASQACPVLVQAGRAADAVKTLEPHILRHPREGGLRADYAFALANAGRLEEALEQARYGAQLDTANPGIPGLVAEILTQVGRPDEAAAYRAQALERQKRLQEAPAPGPKRPVTDSGTR